MIQSIFCMYLFSIVNILFNLSFVSRLRITSKLIHLINITVFIQLFAFDNMNYYYVRKFIYVMNKISNKIECHKKSVRGVFFFVLFLN